MDWSAIGKRIRQQWEYMGLTREQFAGQIEVTPKFCSDIETRCQRYDPFPPSAGSLRYFDCPQIISSTAGRSRSPRIPL